MTDQPNQQQPQDHTSGPARPVRLTAILDDLASARATVHITAGKAYVSFGTVDVKVMLTDRPNLVRPLLTDALAQLDAAEASR